MHEEYIKWAEDEISPVGEWHNHPDSAPNLEEAMNSYHQDLWNSAPVDHSIFSGQIHQQQTYPHVGPSQDQGSSSNTVQPMHSGDFFGGYHGNFVPHFDEFRYPDSSFLPQPHQNFETPHHEQMTQYPAFHSMQIDLSYSPHHSEVGNRGYHNQNWHVSELNPASPSNNYGFLNTGAAIDHRINSIDNENLIYGTSKNSMSKEAHSPDEQIYIFTDREKSRLISALSNGFRRCSRKDALSKMPYRFTEDDEMYLQSIHEKALDFIYEPNPEYRETKLTTNIKFETNDVKKINNLKKNIIIQYIL
ncbi:hypothetical protein PPACK8108_LOCUS15418, partial [Phakopsora pachyrhizi]